MSYGPSYADRDVRGSDLEGREAGGARYVGIDASPEVDEGVNNSLQDDYSVD